MLSDKLCIYQISLILDIFTGQLSWNLKHFVVYNMCSDFYPVHFHCYITIWNTQWV